MDTSPRPSRAIQTVPDVLCLVTNGRDGEELTHTTTAVVKLGIRGQHQDPHSNSIKLVMARHLREPDRQKIVYATAAPVVRPRSWKRVCMVMRRVS